MAKSPIRSIRAPADVWVRVDAAAKKLGLTANAFARDALDTAAADVLKTAGRDAIAATKLPDLRPPAPRPAPKAVLEEAEAKAAHLAQPKPKMSARQREWRSALKKVPVGPVERPPGSMLKGNSKAKR